jgi:branched-subunit amino acid aminotransferase/4-amino-4-deoxychorismate lyase
MRSVVLQEAHTFGLKTTSELVSFEDVLEADECFLTNASKGIQWIGAVGKKRFYKRGAEKLINHINAKFQLN